MKKAVLFLIFNRLDITSKVFEVIKAASPPRLYLASDAGRKNKEGEKAAVEQVRKWVLDNIDWDCKVETFFRDENAGLKKNVSEAISWFFEKESDGIILEDDCIPSQSFFCFCEKLLDYYKDDKRIWHIAGENPLGVTDCNGSYYFAQIEHCWGWATWADRWQYFNLEMPDLEEDLLKIKSNIPNKRTHKYWIDIFKKYKKNEINSWAYIWTYTILKENGFCINPAKNLISNIGFNGIHYSNSQSNLRLNAPIYEIENIVHPKEIKFNEEAIKLINEKVFYIKKPTFKDFLIYMKKYPLFIFRKDFWYNFI